MLAMDKGLWTIAMLVIQPYQQSMIGLTNALEFNFEPPEPVDIPDGTEQSFIFNENFNEFATRPVELPHITGDGISLQSWPAFGKSESTETALRDQWVSQLDWYRSSPSHSDPHSLLGSASCDKAAGTYEEGPEQKRTKTLVHLDQHPPIQLTNCIPSSHEVMINAHSQVSETTSATSADHNYHMNQMSGGPVLVRPLIPSTDVRFTQDPVPLPIHDYRFESYQKGTHQLNNLKQNPSNNPHQPIRTSSVGLETSEFDENYNHKILRPFDNRDSKKKANKTGKRKLEQSNEPSPASSHAVTTSGEIPRCYTLIKNYAFDYHWSDFQPSTIDGELVTEVLANLKLPDGTNFFDYVTGLKHAQEPHDGINHFYHVVDPERGQHLDDTIQNQNPRKLFCLKIVSEENCVEFFKFFRVINRMDNIRFVTNPNQTLYKLTKERFVLHSPEDDFKSDHQSKISQYKMFVLRNFEQPITTSRNSVSKQIESGEVPYTLDHFDMVMRLLPLYLFYVDLISSILPVGAVDTGGELLREQRQIAGDHFIKLLKAALSVNDERYFKVDRNNPRPLTIDQFIEVVRTRKLSDQNAMLGLIWKALVSWMLISRKDLNGVYFIATSPLFKEFFNKLVFSWIDKN